MITSFLLAACDFKWIRFDVCMDVVCKVALYMYFCFLFLRDCLVLKLLLQHWQRWLQRRRWRLNIKHVYILLMSFSYKSIEMFTIVNKLDAKIHIHAQTTKHQSENSWEKMLIGCSWTSFIAVCIFRSVVIQNLPFLIYLFSSTCFFFYECDCMHFQSIFFIISYVQMVEVIT